LWLPGGYIAVAGEARSLEGNRRMTCNFRFAALIAPLALGACAVPGPTGPSVMALPKQGENFSQFQAQDASCRNYANALIGGASPQQAANNSAVGSALLGTAIGAGAGAALGSVGGQVGAGAAIGGAMGLLAGSAIGANTAQAAGGNLQGRYDMAYSQCMVAAGYTVQQPAYGYGYGYPGYGYPGYPAYPYAYPAYPYYYGPTVGIGVGYVWGPRCCWRRW
jgi:hypothetical protein